MITNFKIFENKNICSFNFNYWKTKSNKLFFVFFRQHILIKESLECIKKYLELGYDINYQTDNEDTLLNTTIRKNVDFSIIEFLLKNGADPNLGSMSLYTPLMNAYFYDNFSLISYLMDNYDIDLSKKDNFNNDIFDYKYKNRLDIKKFIRENYPKKYKRYLIEKETKKFNI